MPWRGHSESAGLGQRTRQPSRRASVVADAAAHAHANRVAVLAMVGAMACFVVNDTLVKYASQTVPAAQLIFTRGVIASVLVLAVAQAMGATARIREVARGWVAVRAVVDAFATMLFLVSLFHLPIGSATAINMTSPLFVTLLAALFLGERVGRSLWLATAVGFVGVLLVIQPRSAAFNGYAILCLFSVVLMSVRDLMMRRIDVGVPSILVTLSNTVVVTLLAGAVSLLEGWGPVGAGELGLLAVAAVFLATAYFLIVSSTRRGELSLVAPFRYSALVFATIAGFAVWGDMPNVLAWCGIALLIGSGIHVLRASRRARAAPPALD
jgi:drug/metabolite transporter (DMT)-like permease